MTIPELGDNLTLYAALLGSVMPGLIAAINRRRWAREVKAASAIVISVAVGAGTAYFSGNWDGSDVLRSILIVAFLGQIAYHQFWRPSGLADRLEARDQVQTHREDDSQTGP